MNKLLFLIPLLGLSTTCSGQTLLSQQSIGGTQSDQMRPFKNTEAQQYWLIGTSGSGISGSHTDVNYGSNDFWIVKLNDNLQPLWDKSFGGTAMDVCNDALVTGNRMILSGYSASTISGNKTVDVLGPTDAWIVSLDTLGNINWQQNYGGDGDEGPTSMAHYSDSSFILICNSNSAVSGDKTSPQIGGNDIWMLEIAYSDGHIIRQRTVGTDSDDGFSFPLITETGGIILSSQTDGVVSGDKTDPGYGDYDLWLIEFDSNWNAIRDKCFGGSSMEEVDSGIKKSLDGYFISIMTHSQPSGTIINPTYNSNGYADIWIAKIDLNWNVLWEKTFGGIDYEYGSELSFLSNNNILLSCSSKSSAGSGNKTAVRYGGYDIWTILMDTSGHELAQNTYGGTLDDSGNFFPYNGDTLILCAASKSAVSGNKTVSTNGLEDAWLGILDLSTYLAVPVFSNNQNLLIFPNPSKGTFQLGSHFSESDKLEVFNGLGEKQEVSISNSTCRIKNPGPGVYWLRINDTETYRLVIQ